MLSTTSGHAIRALVEMAGAPAGIAVHGRDLARRAGIPPTYLSKILAALRDAEIVEATRGARGGYRLAAPPGRIRLMDIVACFEDIDLAGRCFLGGGRPCSEASPCGVHPAWSALRDRMIHFLESTTLAAICRVPPVRGAACGGPAGRNGRKRKTTGGHPR